MKVHVCCPLNLIGYELNDEVPNVCLYKFVLFTVSNALLMSKNTATVWCCLGLLKLFVIWWQMLCKAVYVKCLYLNPYWWQTTGMFSVIYGNSACSSALAVGDKRDLDWYLVPMLWSLFGFKMEMVGALFPRCNIVLVLGAVL